MAWCLPAEMWDDPLQFQLSTGLNGGNANGGGGTFPVGTTLGGIVSTWNDQDRLTPYFWSVLDTPAGQCICLETSDPVASPLPTAIKNQYNGTTVNTPFSEKEPEEVKTQAQIDAALQCFADLLGCEFNDLVELDPLTKDDIVAAVQEYITANPGGPTPQTFSGEIVGWNQSTSGNWLYGDWGTPVGTLGPVVNPAGAPGQQIGTLFVDPNLPASATASFDLTYTVLDATGGMGTVSAVEKSTGIQLPGGGYPPGAGGPGQGPVPFDHTVTFTIPAGVDPTDVCVVFNAFGVAPAAPSQWGQDEIDPNPEALVVVTPSACAAANACFEAIFGCTIEELTEAAAASTGGTNPGGFPGSDSGNVFKALLSYFGVSIADFEECVPEPADTPLPATSIPIPDNEVDAAIRTGQAGTSTQYARADHNHPIRVQANPGTPVPVAGGNATISNPINGPFDSNEEEIYFEQRHLFRQDAGTGWGWIAIPNIAGFGRPRIRDLNSYRTPSTAVQLDEPGGQGGDGASPRGPYMGQEISHWSFTRRLYGGYFRRDNPINQYVTFDLLYIRN